MKRSASASELKEAAESIVITLAIAGETSAFTEIVRRRHNRVRNFMRYLCWHPNQADDLAQQAFLKMWQSIAHLRSAAAFDAWLKRIMVTTWLEEVRRNRLPYSPESDIAEAGAYTDSEAERLDLHAALTKLPPPMRLCVVLAYNEGMTHDEIAALTEMPLGTVKSNISRGSARMREILCDYRMSV